MWTWARSRFIPRIVSRHATQACTGLTSTITLGNTPWVWLIATTCGSAALGRGAVHAAPISRWYACSAHHSFMALVGSGVVDGFKLVFGTSWGHATPCGTVTSRPITASSQSTRTTNGVANSGPLPCQNTAVPPEHPCRQQPAGHQMHGGRQDDVFGHAMSDGRARDCGEDHASPSRPATAIEVSPAPNPNAHPLAATTHRDCSGAATPHGGLIHHAAS